MSKPRKDGRFIQKSDGKRKIRSIRATDTTWDSLSFQATNQGISMADLLEQWVSSPPVATATAPSNTTDLEQVISVLEQALTLKANAGGAIKAEIRKALELLT